MSLKDTDPLLLEAVSRHREKAGLRQQEEVPPGRDQQKREGTEGTGHLLSPALIAEGPLITFFSSETDLMAF